MNLDDDLSVKKISRMLEIGGTMLAKHCDTCNAPMFRYKGKELCPVCINGENQRFSEKTVTSKTAQDKKDLVKNIVAPKKDEGHAKTEIIKVCNDVNYVEKLILEKIIRISQDMQHETEYVRILEQLKLVERCVNIVKELKKLQ